MTTLLSRTTAGVYAIAPTPFTTDGDLDLDSLTRLLDFYTEIGVQGVTILGQLGEAPKLSLDESRRVVAHATAHTDLPVVAGITAPGYVAMRDLARFCMDRGAAGVMIAPPNTLRTDAQITNFYANVAAAVAPAPFVLQDYPLSFSVVISESVIETIASDHDNCVMLKHEDWPGLDKIAELRRRERDGSMPRLSILCGNGGLFLDYEMARGADGAMTGYCFPELLLDVVRLAREDSEAAHDIFDAHLPLIRYEQQPGLGLAVRKYILQRRGLIASNHLRAPAPAFSEYTRVDVDHLLRRLARVDARAAAITA
ncbi:dihydrodipicolinate synthase family protein [Mycolicibacterium sp. jd]|uniref:dihydrodipicolinate synthase family protein n=1 Tax=unclassified Mycolicibacterium TaxID=2636767 RepID=UPI00351AE9A5